MARSYLRERQWGPEPIGRLNEFTVAVLILELLAHHVALVIRASQLYSLIISRWVSRLSPQLAINALTQLSRPPASVRDVHEAQDPLCGLRQASLKAHEAEAYSQRWHQVGVSARSSTASDSSTETAALQSGS